MIICSNCGATNSESDGRICRKCGALLPVASKTPRIRIPGGKKEKKKKKKKEITPLQRPTQNQPQGPIFWTQSSGQGNEAGSEAVQFFSPQHEGGPGQGQFNLQAIPKPDLRPTREQRRQRLAESPDKKAKFLQEITPPPFQGSIIASREVYGPPSSKSKENIEAQLTPIPSTHQTHGEDLPKTTTVSVIKQKRLEEDMSSVMSSLSKKLKVPKKERSEPKPTESKPAEEKIPPSSMNEILKQLLNIDMHIEAAAIIKGEGTILASAISNRISDALFATIGQHLSMMGNDIVDSLHAGILKTISVRGTEGVLDLAPIDRNSPVVKDMSLLVFSHPKVKSGVINIAVNLVRKQIKEYLGIEK